MISGHLSAWWLKAGYSWFYEIIRMTAEPLGSSSFLFISGMSTAISYYKRLKKTQNSENYSKKIMRSEYFFRATLLLIVAFIYNFFVTIQFHNILDIWTWFILLTISFCLFLSWPLLETPKIFRIIFGISLWVINFFLLNFLINFQGQLNVWGVLFYILYNNLNLDPLVLFFTYFIIGTVIGEVLFELLETNDQFKNKKILMKKLFLPSLIGGIILIMTGILFNFPSFLHHRTFPWFFYALGVELILISVMFYFEFFKNFGSKLSTKFFFYFSYYSFTIYLLHNLLYFIFLHQLSPLFCSILIIITILITGYLLKIVYHRLGNSFSVKMQIARISVKLAKLINKSS